jgi:L-threonylcarbamoyladenylate synthase
MITEIINSNDKKAMQRAADLIKGGEIVAFPTETVYGLAANAYDESAVAKIFEAKGRPSCNPLIVHIENIGMLEEIAVDIPDEFYMLYERFMPGPLTVILQKNKRVCNGVTAGLDTVAVRFPRHRTAAELIKKSGCPLAAPSANISEHVSPTSAFHVYDDLKGKIPMIIDGGECSIGIESTIIDMSGDSPAILRPGAITKDMLKKIVGEIREPKNRRAGAVKSPGTMSRHYAPRVKLLLAKSTEEAVILYDSAAKDKKAVIIARASNIAAVGNRTAFAIPDDAKGYAKRIYALLRLAEEAADLIICEEPDELGTGCSIINRLTKASND